MQNILFGVYVKNSTFSILSWQKLNPPQLFLARLDCAQQYLGQILVAIEKLLVLDIVAFMPMKVVSVDNIIRKNHFYYFIKFMILKVNFEWKFESFPVKSVLCILKIFTNHKLPLIGINSLKLKFWKFISNS